VRQVAYLVIALVFGVTVTYAASPEGYWYGRGYQPELRKVTEWLVVRGSDGSYSVEFRDYNNCQLKSVQLETGRWTVSGSRMTIKTLTVDGRAVPDTPYYTDRYDILELDDQTMRIVHERTGQEWALQRVTPDFTFPECKNVS
jgi:Lipocalin-like domain